MPEVRVHTCALLRREALLALRESGLGHIEVRAHGVRCTGCARSAVPPDAPSEPEQGPKQHELAVVLGGPCVRELGARFERGSLALRTPETCFHLFADELVIDRLLSEGAYLLTPGWLATWRQRMGEMGLDQATARVVFGETATKLSLLETEPEHGPREELGTLAAWLGLPAETVPVGLEHLRLVLDQAVRELVSASTARRLADHALVLEVVSRLDADLGEEAIAVELAGLLHMLLSPSKVALALVEPRTGALRRVELPHPSDVDDADLGPADDEVTPTHSGRGLRVRLAHDGRELARAVVEDVAFPEFLAAYRDLARALAQAGAMALAAARDRAALISARDELERERDLLRGLLPICSSCKKVRDDKDHWTQVEAYVASRSHATFTHGICPECIARLYPDYVKD